MKLGKIFAAVFAVLFCSFSVHAEDIGVGNKILATGVAPAKPGFNYFFENDYYFGKQKDKDGKDLSTNDKINVFVNAHVFEYVTPIKFLGATYSADMVAAFASVSTKSDKPDKDGNKKGSLSGITDFYVEPVVLSWSSKYVDSKFVVGFNTPTGEAGISKDHWSVAVSGDFAIFFNPERTIELALLPTYEIHSDNLSSDLKEGDDLILKYALGYKFLGVNEIGVHGYSVLQMTDDLGGGKKAGEDNVHAAGIQYQRWFESVGVQLSALFSQEFGAKGRSQGSRFHVTLIKPI